MTNSKSRSLLLVLWLLALGSLTAAYGQVTPSQDAYTSSAAPTTNYGSKPLLDVDAATQITYIQFDLSSIPAGTIVGQATLKLFVNAVTTPGSFNVDYVNGTWSESKITYSLAPALGSAIVSSVPITAVDKNQYILVNITPAAQAWLSGSQANDGIALVANGAFKATFDSKENTTTSHPPELDIVFAGSAITGITTASSSGLTGGGTSGTLNLSLLTTCSTGQILAWNGSAWVCKTVSGTGTVTSVGSGVGLTGGPITTSGTLSIDPTAVPLLSASNTFTVTQYIKDSSSAVAFDVAATGDTYGIVGSTTGSPGAGVTGFSLATTGGNAGVLGTTQSPTGYGVLGEGGIGVQGQSGICCGPAGNFLGYTAPSGSGNSGGRGVNAAGGNGDPNGGLGGAGVVATGGTGTIEDAPGGIFYGGNSGSGHGDGIWATAGSGLAGNFTGGVAVNGNMLVTGTLAKGGGSFKIDHPLDPANKYLYHSFVESPDMMNIYNGNAVLDSNGEAAIDLPDWFGALNRDFRYQLTCIGGFAPVYVAEEVSNNRFRIAGGKPGIKVSWQVTGIRQDAWANAHRIPVEEEKNARERGFYLHPDLYGAPEEKQVEWASDPEMMKQIKERRDNPRSATRMATLPPALHASK